MELGTIEVDKDEAKQKFEEYRAAVRERHNAEDEEIMRAYRALAKGTPVLKLSEALKRGGTTTVQVRSRDWQRNVTRKTYVVPRLAVARAHAKFAWTRGIDSDGELQIQGKQEIAPHNNFDRVRFPAGTFDAHEHDVGSWWSPNLRAMVPNVPPPLRPAHKLSGYHLLWEAEWKIHPPPPGDPALLKQISGDLYAVLAVWDLTEVEQAVLAGRTAE